ncbi:MAG: hypothetical protein LCH95_14750 [Proteobacteria bacterium]|nr:hypothetical protein [Pseudomonadota bacterium]
MPDSRPLLKEAILRAVADERVLARRLALAVLERLPGDDLPAPPDWRAEAARLEGELVAQQHTVDRLKDTLARLPESQQTY